MTRSTQDASGAKHGGNSFTVVIEPFENATFPPNSGRVRLKAAESYEHCSEHRRHSTQSPSLVGNRTETQMRRAQYLNPFELESEETADACGLADRIGAISGRNGERPRLLHGPHNRRGSESLRFFYKAHCALLHRPR